MRRSLSTPLRLTLHALLAVALVAAASAPAFAATAAKGTPSGGGGTHGGGKGGGGGGSGGGGTTTTGYDVSWPQCGTSLPTSTAFGIVGLNDGLANNLNPCLGDQLTWAATTSNGSAGTPRVQLYVNTADPGNFYNGAPIADWPQSSVSADPYGDCTTTTVTSRGTTYTVGQNSTACAWQYGYNRAAHDAAWLTAAASDLNSTTGTSLSTNPGDYPWWLDVETGNSWMSDLSMNVTDLQGMIAGLRDASASGSLPVVGVYSTAYQWSQITGLGATSSSTAAGSLYRIPVWIPGAHNLKGAQSNCSQTSFTGSATVTLTQWTATLDNDYVC